MSISFVGSKALPPVVEADIPLPLRRDLTKEISNCSVFVPRLENAEIRVHRCEEVLDIPDFYISVVLLDCPPGVMDNSIAGIHPIELYMRADKLNALRVMLAIKLGRLQLASERGEAFADVRHKSEGALLVVRHYYHVVNEANIFQPTLVEDIMVDIVEVVIHCVLPDEMPYGSADAVRLAE